MLVTLPPFIQQASKDGLLQKYAVPGSDHVKGVKGDDYVTVVDNYLCFIANQQAGTPKTFDDLLASMQTISDFGVPPLSIGAANGWTLTDIFENIYLAQAGAEKYDQLTAHQIPWTDPSVKDALTTMAKMVKSEWLPGGTAGTLQTEFPVSVQNMFSNPPKAAMEIEADFVGATISGNTKAKVGADAIIDVRHVTSGAEEHLLGTAVRCRSLREARPFDVIGEIDVPQVEDYVVPIGKAKVVREGTDVTLVSYSIGVGVSLDAANQLSEQGIEAEVIDLRTLRPLDRATVLKSLAKTNRMVCVEEGWPVCSISSELMAMAMEEMRRLVEDLEQTAAPRTCPHGRPTLVHLGTDAIERQFGRR